MRRLLLFAVNFLEVIHIAYAPGAVRKEVELLEKLLYKYNTDALPRYPGKIVNVTFDLALKQIMDLDEKIEILTVNAWVRLYWHDPFLLWNATEWEDIASVAVSPDKIWKPDLTLYNNAEKDFQGLDQYGKTKISIYSNGDIVWLIPTLLRSSCKLEMTYFPFDEQTCPLTFGSWAFDEGNFDLHPKNFHGDLSQLSKSGEFIIEEFTALRKSVKYPCCLKPYATLTYRITLHRRAKFYLFNLILPGVLIALLSCFSFFLPPLSGERTGLVITNFLSLSVYVLIVSDSVPPSSETVPLLVKFYTILVSEIGLALMTNCVVISLTIKSSPVPEWVRVVFLNNHCKNLTKVFRTKFYSKFRVYKQNHVANEEHFEKNIDKKNKKSESSLMLRKDSIQVETVFTDETELGECEDFQCAINKKSINKINYVCSLCQNIEKNDTLKNIGNYLDAFSKDNEIAKDWENVVKSIDRVCFLVFLFIIMGSAVLIFSGAPQSTF